MRIYAVNCDEGRANRLFASSAPLNVDLVLVPSPLKDDPEVIRRGATCFERKTSYPTGLAATLGHIRAMKQLVEDNQPWGIIIEDDVRFRKDFNEIVRYLEETITDADIVTLGYVNVPYGYEHPIPGNKLIKDVHLGNPWGAQCYMITKEYAKHLVDTFSVDDVAIPYSNHFVTDWVLFDPVLGCRRHTLKDPIAIEGPDEQTIAGSTNKPDLWLVFDRESYFI